MLAFEQLSDGCLGDRSRILRTEVSGEKASCGPGQWSLGQEAPNTTSEMHARLSWVPWPKEEQWDQDRAWSLRPTHFYGNIISLWTHWNITVGSPRIHKGLGSPWTWGKPQLSYIKLKLSGYAFEELKELSVLIWFTLLQEAGTFHRNTGTCSVENPINGKLQHLISS